MDELLLTTNYIKSRISTIPDVLIICGSGLSNLSEAIKGEKIVINYDDIPNFPRTTVKGHASEMVFGKINDVNVAMLRGRFHSYEGNSMQTCVLPVRVFAKLGTRSMIVTNAAGGLNGSFHVGDIMVISDHIGLPLLAGKGPLLGPNDDSLGPRFPPMSNAYNAEMRDLASEVAEELNFTGFVRTRGTYVMVSGPQYETAAESAYLRSMGADAVGMSTVPEVTAAHHAGMRVLGLSLITNNVVFPDSPKDAKVASHAEVLETTQMRTKDMQLFVETILARFSRLGVVRGGDGKAEAGDNATALGAAAAVKVATSTSGVASTPISAIMGKVPSSTEKRGDAVAATAVDVAGTSSTTVERDVINRLRKLNVANLTPLQAITILNEVTRSLRGEAAA